MTRKEQLAEKINRHGWSSLTKEEYKEYMSLHCVETAEAKPEQVEENEEDAEY